MSEPAGDETTPAAQTQEEAITPETQQHEQKQDQQQEEKKGVDANAELSFKVLEDLGLEKPAIGRTMRVVIIERIMNYWPNSKQVRVLDANNEARSIFFYTDDPSPHFDYTDVSEGNLMFIKEPRAHFFMDGQIGLRVEDASAVRVEVVPNFDKMMRMNFAEAEKASGTKRYTDKKWEHASDRYAAAVKHLEGVPERDEDTEEKKVDLFVSCYLNLAASLLQDKKYDVVITNCQRANEKRETAKAYFRMAQAQIATRDTPSAEENLVRALHLEPNDKLIKQKLNEIRKEKQEAKETESKLWSGVFKK